MARHIFVSDSPITSLSVAACRSIYALCPYFCVIYIYIYIDFILYIYIYRRSALPGDAFVPPTGGGGGGYDEAWPGGPSQTFVGVIYIYIYIWCYYIYIITPHYIYIYTIRPDQAGPRSP